MTVSWEQALAQCEARLHAAAEALEGGTAAAVEPFSASEIDGPLPAAFADRARACSARGEELTRQMTEELERVRLELRRLPRMPRAQSETRLDIQA